jgi:hypothetical protein
MAPATPPASNPARAVRDKCGDNHRQASEGFFSHGLTHGVIVAPPS